MVLGDGQAEAESHWDDQWHNVNNRSIQFVNVMRTNQH